MPDVESSAIRSVEHDGWDLLKVTFTSGRAYAYAKVPVALYKAFLAAASKGEFFNDEIRDRYPFVEITGRRGRAR